VVSETPVRIMFILDDCGMFPFLNHVCSSLVDFLARSIKRCWFAKEWRAAEVVILQTSWLLDFSGSQTAIEVHGSYNKWVL
jgi:hypothetical protein